MSYHHSDAHTEDGHQLLEQIKGFDEFDFEDEDAYWSSDEETPKSKKSPGSCDSSQNNHHMASTLSASIPMKKTGVKGPKTFALPVDRGSYQTQIAADATLDDEGYPLLPNGHTTFVLGENQKKPANWGSFGFAYTTSGGGTNRGTETWRTVRYTCLGVIVCDNLVCDHRGSPFTSCARRAEWEAAWVFLCCIKSWSEANGASLIYLNLDLKSALRYDAMVICVGSSAIPLFAKWMSTEQPVGVSSGTPVSMNIRGLEDRSLISVQLNVFHRRSLKIQTLGH